MIVDGGNHHHISLAQGCLSKTGLSPRVTWKFWNDWLSQLWGRGMVGGGQGRRSTPHSAQHSPTAEKDLAPNVSRAEAEKPALTD